MIEMTRSEVDEISKVRVGDTVDWSMIPEYIVGVILKVGAAPTLVRNDGSIMDSTSYVWKKEETNHGLEESLDLWPLTVGDKNEN